MDRLRTYWPLIAFLVSGALLAGAHAFEAFGGLIPCPLCLEQRRVHWAILGVSAALFLVTRMRPAWSRSAIALIGILFLVSFASAGRHVAVEQHWITWHCDVAPGPVDLRFDVNRPLVLQRCDQPAWTMLGISMAGFNALISVFMALASFLVAFAPRRSA